MSLLFILIFFLDDDTQTTRERMMAQVKTLLYDMYDFIDSSSTQQEIADAIKILEKSKSNICNREFDITSIKPPATNLNTKGKKATIKNSTERLKSFHEIFEKRQEDDLKKKERQDKKDAEIEKKKKTIRNRNFALQS